MYCKSVYLYIIHILATMKFSEENYDDEEFEKDSTTENEEDKGISLFCYIENYYL